ncbi:MAG: glycoside hydrolase domain-containing protein [Mycobacterium sp.]|uniref:glycoside hydrolase domain-containing protein n=1 Tax=Mycobacterium sp. TaxID=1785 RepID=UPI003F9B033F
MTSLSDGGANLPAKQLQPAEAADLQNAGIEIVSNWETTAQMMLGGYNQGVTDAGAARNQMVACGGPATAPIYFSCDFDEAASQQAAINAYLQGCCDVRGGPGHVGIYGGYWPVMRALNAGVCAYAWQTEAWSGGNVDSRVNIIQRNQVGYLTVAGVQTDVNEAHTDDIGQWHNYAVVPPVPAPVPDPGGPPDYAILAYEQLAGPRGTDGYGHGWDQLGGLTVVDFLARYKPLWDAQLAALPPAPAPAPTPVPVPAQARSRLRGNLANPASPASATITSEGNHP